ncbi:metallophosphoesterase family protein [Deinococcus aquiradiocola]|uniref:Metallophosphoesterase n=1 Tax=Deinococcus aquiradiocola TaxID=393059 RepID=A0A917P676_9DEIO|nr:metallophosphoesterase [Deinococcus aquiradiocola]GGJ63743.1 metallophosphoesterase [Deinococcus aquiradiocola]
MRLAVIADIHGNLDALDAVLSDLQGQNPDRVIVNGDVVNRGPDSVACLERVLALPGATFTLGNHDDLMLLWQERSPDLPADWFTDPFWGATDWSARQLHRAGLLDVIRGWPMTLRPHTPDLPDVVVAHGSPHHYREAVGAFTTPERAAELFSASGAQVLVASHIHRPLLRDDGGRWLINTGAVGAPFDGDPRARYLLLDGQGGQWTPTIRAVPYDRSGVTRRFRTSGLLEHGGLSARIFLDELHSARSIYTPFWDFTAEHRRPRDAGAYRDFTALHPDLFLPA